MKRRPKKFDGATHYFDCRGKMRWRYRKGAYSRDLGAVEYGSDEFIRRYEAAVAGRSPPGGAGASRTRRGTVSAVIASLYQSPGFRGLKVTTRQTYRNVYERLRREHGHRLVADMQRRHVMQIIAKKADTPGAANFLLRMVRQLLDHAIDLELRTDNPARLVKMYATGGTGRHTWTEDEIARFYAVHRPGSIAHLAMTLMLYTGAARSDAVALGWANVRGGRLVYRRRKTARTKARDVTIPIHDQLAAVLNRLPRDAFTFLETRLGAARSPNGLGNDMRRWCDDAGLPECTSHGLRRAMARRLAEAGATTKEIMAAGGWSTSKEVDRYTADADREALATAGFEKLTESLKREQNLANHPKRFARKSENRND